LYYAQLDGTLNATIIQPTCTKIVGNCSNLNFGFGFLPVDNQLYFENVVLYPKEDSYDYVAFSQSAVVTVLFIITVLISAVMFFNIIIVIMYKDQKDIDLRKPVFLVCQNVGAIILLSSNYFSIGFPTTTYCIAQMVFILIGFDLFYIPFFVKSLRLYILFTVSLDQQISIRDYFLYACIAIFIFLDSIILVAWFISFPITVDRKFFLTDDSYNYYYVSCTFNNGFLLGVLIYKTVLCALVWIISDLSAQIVFKLKMDKKRKRWFRRVNDAVDIKFGITFTLVVLVIVLIVLLMVNTNPKNTFYALCITIWISTAVPLGLIMYSVFKDLRTPPENQNSTSSTGTVSALKTCTLHYYLDFYSGTFRTHYVFCV